MGSALSLSAPQDIYLNQLNTKFKAYVGGFGSGKTYVGCLDNLLFAARHPKTKQGYFGPTYGSIRDVFYPTYDEAAHSLGFRTDIKETNKEVHIYRGRAYYGTTICRSLDNPNSIVGFKISRGHADELDTLAINKAENAWNKMIARLRLKIDGVENCLGVSTTPEGFKFVYDKFAKNPTKSYSMVQASTYENMDYLNIDYIPSLLETYPEQLALAYINGEFVNLTSGSVYKAYDRIANGTDRVWDGKEPVYIGMDFNVGKMAAIVHVMDDGKPRAVDEIINAYDTPDMISVIKSRYPNTTVRIYPDASGDSRKSVDASKTDISLLEGAGFTVCANKKNPSVKDRVNSMNVAFCNNNQERLYLINVDKCPTYADCLEQQTWNDNGEPDKSQGKDHANDAGGYFIAYNFPIIKPARDIAVKFSY